MERWSSTDDPDTERTRKYNVTDESMNPPFKAYSYSPPHEEALLTVGKISQRLIFMGGTQYEDWEEELLGGLEEYMIDNKLSFSEPIPKHLKMRFRVGVETAEQCYTELEQHLAWRKESIPPTVTSRTGEILESGFMYVHGWDWRYRPGFVIEPYWLDELQIPADEKVDAVLKATTFMLEYIILNCLLPGQIENWITIMNVNKQGVMSVDWASL